MKKAAEQVAECQDFCIGVGNKLIVLYKPRIAQCLFVALHTEVGRNNVAGIQHGQNALNDVVGKIEIHDVLIATKFYGTITTYLMVEYGRLGIAERIDGKVDIADGEEVEGAAIQIIDDEGNVVEEWTSTEKAHEIEGLTRDEILEKDEVLAALMKRP